jgi:molybdopterin-guanine dinucleotide biosynthesis protein A
MINTLPTAAILAGGGARRFGGLDKGSLVVEGRSILERQLEELASLTDDILVIGRSEMDCDLSAWRDRGVHVRAMPDRVAGRGPLGGLEMALAASRAEALVVVACDMPFVTAALLAYLAALSTGADAVVPVTDRGCHSLCAVYTRACLPAIRRQLARGRLAMNGLLDDLRVRQVTVLELGAFGEPERLLTNINTADEYTRLVLGDVAAANSP